MDEQIEQQNEAWALRRRMTRGTVGTAIQRCVELLTGLLMVPFTLHWLGQAAYGYWALVYAVANYLNLSDLGFTAALNHHFVTALTKSPREERQSLFSSAFVYLFAVAAVVFLVGLSLEPLIIHQFPGASEFGDSARWAWRGTMLVLALGFLTNYGRSLFFATHRVAWLSLLNTSFVVLYALAVVSVLLPGWGLTGMAAASAGVAVLRLLVTFGFGIKGVPDFAIRLSHVRREVVKRLWTFGLRVFAARVAEVIYVNFDRILLGRVLGVAAVTPYDVGAKASGSAANVPMIMLPVIEPEAARFQANGEMDRLALLIRRSSRYTALLGFALVGALVALAPEAIRLWIGEQTSPRMVLALRVLVFAHVGMSLTGPLRSVARGIGKPGWEARAALVQAGMNILLSIILYLRFGFSGILFGTVGAVAVGQGYFVLQSLGSLGMRRRELLFGSWLRPLLAALLAAGVVFAAKGIPLLHLTQGGRVDAILPLLLLGLIFILIYIVSVFLFGAITGGEIAMLMKALRGRERP